MQRRCVAARASVRNYTNLSSDTSVGSHSPLLARSSRRRGSARPRPAASAAALAPLRYFFVFFSYFKEDVGQSAVAEPASRGRTYLLKFSQNNT